MHGLALAISPTLPLPHNPAPNPSPTPDPNPNPNTRYGPLRLPMLLSGWAEAARLGWEEVPSPYISIYLPGIPCISPVSPLSLWRRGSVGRRSAGDVAEIWARYRRDIGEI